MPRKKKKPSYAHLHALNAIGAYGPGDGYSIDAAWKVAMGPDGSHSVVDLEGGGYAVPIERSKKIAPPSKTKPILARIPSGVVALLPSRFGVWRIVGAK